MPRTPRRRRRALWIVLVIVVILLIPVAIIAVPILTHQDAGLPGAQEVVATTATSTGDDGRTRTIDIAGAPLDALSTGDRLVVTGAGFDGSRGIYVAICKVPDAATTKPGPCIGGVPEQDGDTVSEGTIQYAPSNWINDDWAWKLLGARSYDSVDEGTFTAYIEVGDPVSDTVDCTVDECAVYTRNDHTALGDRVQDLYVPVHFAPVAD
jgi:hypothetical protein